MTSIFLKLVRNEMKNRGRNKEIEDSNVSAESYAYCFKFIP